MSAPATPAPIAALTGAGYVPIIPPPQVVAMPPPQPSGGAAGAPAGAGGGPVAAGIQIDGKTFSSVSAAQTYLQGKHPGATVSASAPDSAGNVTFTIRQPGGPGPRSPGATPEVQVDGQTFPSVSAATSYLEAKYPGATVTPTFSSGAGGALTGFSIAQPSGSTSTAPASQSGGGGWWGSIETAAGQAFGGLVGGFNSLFMAGASTEMWMATGGRSAAVDLTAGQEARLGMVTANAAYFFPGGAILHGVGTPAEGAGARVLDVVIGSLPFIPFGELGGAAGRAVASPLGRLAAGAAIGGAGPVVRGDYSLQDIAVGAAIGGAMFTAPELARGGYSLLRGGALRLGSDVGGFITSGESVRGGILAAETGGAGRFLEGTALGQTTGTRAGFTAAEESSLARGTGGLPLPLSARFGAGEAGEFDVLAARPGETLPLPPKYPDVPVIPERAAPPGRVAEGVGRRGQAEAASTEGLTTEEEFQLGARNIEARMTKGTISGRLREALPFKEPGFKPAPGATKGTILGRLREALPFKEPGFKPAPGATLGELVSRRLNRLWPDLGPEAEVEAGPLRGTAMRDAGARVKFGLSMPGRRFSEGDLDRLFAENLPRPYMKGAFRPGESFTVGPVEEAGGEGPAAGAEGPASAQPPTSVPTPGPGARPVAAVARARPADVEFVSLRTPEQPPPQRATPSLLFTSLAGPAALRSAALLGQGEGLLARQGAPEVYLSAVLGAPLASAEGQPRARLFDTQLFDAQFVGASRFQEEARAYTTTVAQAYVFREEAAPLYEYGRALQGEAAPADEYGRGLFPFAPGSGGGGASRRPAGKDEYGYLEVFRNLHVGLGGRSGLERFIPKRGRA